MQVKPFQLLFIIGFISYIFIGCSNKEVYTGKWHAQLRNGENVLTLYENGDYTWYMGQAMQSFHKGKWEVKGDSLYMSDYEIGVSEMWISYYIIRVNEYQLILKTSGANWAAQIYEFEKKH